MIALVQGAINTNVIITGAALRANLPAGAIGAHAAFKAKSVAAIGAFIAVFAIRLSVDPFITDGAYVSGVDLQRPKWDQTHQHHQGQNNPKYSSANIVFHFYSSF